MPKKLIANRPYSSAPFFAVVLETYKGDDDCDGGEFRISTEAKRKQVQQEYPTRKVFASYQCPDMASIGYDFDGRWDSAKENLKIAEFMAVYAGATKDEAEKLLQQVRAKYPKAMIKRMTATFEMIEQ